MNVRPHIYNENLKQGNILHYTNVRQSREGRQPCIEFVRQKDDNVHLRGLWDKF